MVFDEITQIFLQITSVKQSIVGKVAENRRRKLHMQINVHDVKIQIKHVIVETVILMKLLFSFISELKFNFSVFVLRKRDCKTYC